MKFLKFLFIFSIFLFSFSLIFAHQDLYRVNVSDTVEINEWDLCWQVTNNGLFDLMVPTKSALEWYLFNQSSPNGVELSECGNNNFGDGRDGNIWVKNDGIYQDLGEGYNILYNSSQWPSIEDGDMVVINAKNFIVDDGVNFTTTNRCRGLMIYTTGDMIVNGTISMSARGAHANPLDSTITGDTPVISSDGNAVSSEGLIIRRDKNDWSDITSDIIDNAHASNVSDFKGSDNSNELFYGTGLDSVYSETNQEEVENGLVIKIPVVGGIGAQGTYVKYNTGKSSNGFAGKSIMFGTGGGGSGAGYGNDPDRSGGIGESGEGGMGTLFSGGSGSGGAQSCTSDDADDYGGEGTDGCSINSGGAGNPPGDCGSCRYGSNPGGEGTGGLLLIFVRNNLVINGEIESTGIDGGVGHISGGSSGGGILGIFYAGLLFNNGVLNVSGGFGYDGGFYSSLSGAGGNGSIIGPIQIASGPDACELGKIRYKGQCVNFDWVEYGDWSDCSVDCWNGTQTQTVTCETENGDIIDDKYCEVISSKPIDSKSCYVDTCIWTGGQEISGYYNPWPNLAVKNVGWYDCGSIGDRCLKIPSNLTCTMYESNCNNAKFCYDKNGQGNGDPTWYVICHPN